MRSFKLFLITSVIAFDCIKTFAASYPIAGGSGSLEVPRSSVDPMETLESEKTRGSGRINRQKTLASFRSSGAGISLEDYKHLKGSSARQATRSGNLQAHGITGDGVTVWILESGGINEHPDVARYVDPSSKMTPATGFMEKQDHGAAMTSLVHQVAPGARLVVQHKDESFRDKIASTSLAECPQIINASFGISAPETMDSYFGFIRGDARLGWRTPLVVYASGNHQENLSTDSVTKELSDDLAKYILFAGNLGQDNRVIVSSGIPGDNQKIQGRFLWVMADDMRVAGGPTGKASYKYSSGTSNAAAILSGAASLIKSAFPQMTMDQVAECLLESADQDFFGYIGDGHHAVHVMPKGQIEAASSDHVAIQDFDPALWGKGILNVPNAYIYAKIKAQGNSALSSSYRKLMQEADHDAKQGAADVLGKWWRGSHKKVAADKRPPALTIDPTLPNRTYEEAEGRPGTPSVPQPSPEEVAKNLGLKSDDIKLPPIASSVDTEVVHTLRSGKKSFEEFLKEVTEKHPMSDGEESFLKILIENPGILQVTQDGTTFAQYLFDKSDHVNASNLGNVYLYRPTFYAAYRIIEALFRTPSPVLLDLVCGIFPEAMKSWSLKLKLKDFFNNLLSPDVTLTPFQRLQVVGHSLCCNLSQGYEYTSGNPLPIDTEKLWDEYQALDPSFSKSLNQQGDTIFHLIAYQNPNLFWKFFKEVLVEKGALIETLDHINTRGTTVFGILIRDRRFHEPSKFLNLLQEYIINGKNIRDSSVDTSEYFKGTFIEAVLQQITPSHFNEISCPSAPKEWEYGYVSEKDLQNILMGLKILSPLFDIPALNKTVSTPIFDGAPNLSGMIRSHTSSGADWDAGVDSAWAWLLGKLETGVGKNVPSWDGKSSHDLVKIQEGVRYFRVSGYKGL